MLATLFLVFPRFRFFQPATAQFARRHTRSIGFYIENRCSIQHINAAQMKKSSFSAQQLDICQADRVGTPRRTRRENPMDPVIGWGFPHQFIICRFVKNPENHQVGKALYILQTRFEFGKNFQPSLHNVLCAQPLGNLGCLSVVGSDKSDWFHSEFIHHCPQNEIIRRTALTSLQQLNKIFGQEAAMSEPLRGRVQIVAHRGASGYAPETTLEAYRLALEMGADYVEADIHMLRDGTLVAMHDADVRRTTGSRGKLSDLTLPEIKTLDAGKWFNNAYPEKARPEYAGLRIPTLQEILDLVRTTSAGCYLETKDPDRYPPILESELISLLYKSGMEKRTRVISFSAQSIEKIRVLDESIATGLLISKRGKDPVKAALRVPADELAIRHDLATAAIVESAHKNGISVSVWTVDREKDFNRVIRLGVDRIITNYPSWSLSI